MASSELLVALRLSDITTSVTEISDYSLESLSNFINDARMTARGLLRLSVKVFSAVDEAVAVNDCTIRSIQAARTRPTRFAVKSLLQSFHISQPSDSVIRPFSEAMDVLSSQLRRLILEAEIQLVNLEKLEEDLTLLHALVLREDILVSSAKSEVLSELWTKFGGNRRILRSYDDNLALLKNLAMYRKQALVQVVTSLQILRSLSDEMEELRERVSVSAIAVDRIPVEVHLKSISSGLERLKITKMKAKEKEKEDQAVGVVLPRPVDIAIW
ncbi:hypothetical protein L218DRAFT_991170 [Marasmius fiardii PR-910]|nr:hypothetical protein L218DRAFT_991170 [Marasmius fiardii PR-910]